MFATYKVHSSSAKKSPEMLRETGRHPARPCGIHVCGRKTTNVNEQSQSRPENITEFPTSGVIPAARPLADFAFERVGDDLILFDGETMQYHTLNGMAERIWRACDGTATLAAIAAATSLPLEVVEITAGELGEASLLQTSAGAWSVPMNRRSVAKLIAAGVVGVVGVPAIKSITAPDAASAASNIPNGSDCAQSEECQSSCCLDLDRAWNICREWQIPVFWCNQIYRYGQVCSPGPVTVPVIEFSIPCM